MPLQNFKRVITCRTSFSLVKVQGSHRKKLTSSMVFPLEEQTLQSSGVDEMEWKRSVSFKLTGFLFFCFTISSSLVTCFLFYYWVLQYYSLSGSHELHFQFRSFIQATDDGNLLPLGGNFSVSGSHVWDETGFGEISDSFRNVLSSVQDSKITPSSDAQFSGEISSPDVASDSSTIKKDTILKDPRLSESPDSSLWNRSNPNPVVAYLGESTTASDGDVSEEKKIVLKKSSKSTGATSSAFAVNIEKEKRGSCDVSKGKWVFDEDYPLYSDVSCPYIDEGFRCQTNGRVDSDYMKWRWQPDDCIIPRFDAVSMLKMVRGKRLVFIGDSINRNQWESMLCLLRSGIKDYKRVYEARGRRITKERGNYNFKFVDFQCSVEYYVSHFLVHESKAKVGKKRVPTLRIDTIDRSSSRWRGADILVFNSAHWWSHYKTKAGKNYYQEGNQVHPQLDVSTAFRKAMTTWASWVDQNVNPDKTQVFFRSSAPSHFHGGEWNSGGHCKENIRPLNDTSIRKLPENNIIVEEIIRQMKTPVTLLNITNLSGFRIDGHPSVYGKPSKDSLTGVQDCSHWCLPGVPDTWNELLYFYVSSKQKPVFTE